MDTAFILLARTMKPPPFPHRLEQQDVSVSFLRLRVRHDASSFSRFMGFSSTEGKDGFSPFETDEDNHVEELSCFFLSAVFCFLNHNLQKNGNSERVWNLKIQIDALS